MRTLKFVIQYDGTRYYGWQRQSASPTIQQILEETLQKIIHEPVNVKGSGRTDRGVHALAQVAHCRVETSLGDQTLLRAMNSLLPEDIVIKELKTETDSFDAQKNVSSKIYFYQILNTPLPDPMLRHFCWWIPPPPNPIDRQAMNLAASLIEGEHDFSAFRNHGGSIKTTVRTVYRSHFFEQSPYLIYEIEGSGFLKQMVRNLVSALVRVGRHQMSIDQFKAIFDSKDRRRAPPPAPPAGLFLKSVTYFH